MKKQLKFSSNVMKGGLAMLALLSTGANAATFSLCAGEVVKTMPDGRQVKMWGYGLDGATCTPTVPGPRLTVPSGDTVLTINLRNTLPEPVSVTIPGLATNETPVFFTDAQGRRRVRSMVHETATNSTSNYTFVASPGTYLYQSGSHPAVQVQMGLYGAATNDAAAGQAYPGVNYDNEVMVLYSEIDPDLHDAIAGAAVDNPATTIDETVPTYGTANGPTSTINYKPRYFLVNGDPYTSTTADLSAGGINDRNLVRFLNAGLQSHSPALVGGRLSLVAESGNLYPYARDQYSMLLSAGQTRDAIFTSSTAGRFALYDGQLKLSNNGQPGDGGMMSHLVVGSTSTGTNPPVAVDDAATTPEDTPVTIDVAANDTDNTGIDPTSLTITRQAYNGVASLSGGSVLYSPNANFNGTDTFTYTVRDIDGNVSNTATVTVTVTAVNDAPVGVADSYSTPVDTALNVTAPGVLANDTDVDSATLTASLVTGPTQGVLTLNADGSFTYTPNTGATGSDTFTYVASDGLAPSANTLVTITIATPANQPPVANDDYASVTRNTGASNNVANVIVLANDTDADGTLNPASVTLVVNPLSGTATVNADGSITYKPKAGFTGSDSLAYTVEDNTGAVSNTAVVRLDVIRP